MTPEQARDLQKSLRSEIRRADLLAARCSEASTNPLIRPVDQATMLHRAHLARKTSQELGESLQEIEKAQ